MGEDIGFVYDPKTLLIQTPDNAKCIAVLRTLALDFTQQVLSEHKFWSKINVLKTLLFMYVNHNYQWGLV